MKSVITPAETKKDFYQILKYVATNHQPIIIQQKNNNLDTVIISKSDYNALQETLYLANTKTLTKVTKRIQDNSGFTNINDALC